jgi:hypothetical protein
MPRSSPDSTSGRSPDSPNREVHMTPRTGSRDPRRHPFRRGRRSLRRRLPSSGSVGADDRVLPRGPRLLLCEPSVVANRSAEARSRRLARPESRFVLWVGAAGFEPTTTGPPDAPFATIERMVRGDWPELEYLVIGTGVRVLRANEAAASISAAVQALNEATSALPQQPTAADVSKLAKMCAAQVAALEAAATALETEMAAIAPGQNRIIDIIDADHEATGVAEEYLGGAVSLGVAAAYVIEELARLPRSLEKLGRTLPMVEEATVGLASAIRRVLVALEPAIEWGARSTAILSDWT